MPISLKVPAPVMLCAIVGASLRRYCSVVPLARFTVLDEAIAPLVPPAPTCSVPAFTSTPPVEVLLPVRVKVALPFLISLPVPETTPAIELVPVWVMVAPVGSMTNASPNTT